MKQGLDPTTTRRALRRSVDELSSRAKLAGGVEAIAPVLAELALLAAHAEAVGHNDVAALARRVTTGAEPAAVTQTLGLLSEALATNIATLLSLAADPEMIRGFAMEAQDHLADIETQVLALEHNPSDIAAVHTIFRAFHTIKGLAGFVELPVIQQVAHEIETLLECIRKGRLEVTGELVDVVLCGTDYLRTEIERVVLALDGAAGGPNDASQLLSRVRAIVADSDVPGGMPDAAVKSAEQAVGSDEACTAEKKSSKNKSRLIKVDTDKLDFLVDMVGELVIAQSMVDHDGQLSALANPNLQRNLAQLSRITGEVQKTAMSMRMVPIRQLFQRSARLIRDLTRKSGKQVTLEVSGEETELDRTIVEELSDPLMHMIRNAADHGVEHPAERVRAGKNPTACLGLRAYHQSGHIVVEISDDGRGLDREKLIAKARQNGLIPATADGLPDGSGLSDKQIFPFIFEPGFSTAEEVTDLSGRGVGMDVVRRQIQKLRGRVDIESRAGVGTTFFLKLPLTLAIIDGLLVGLGKERYVIPIFVVQEIFRPQAEAIFTVEQNREMVLVRGTLLPIVRLHERLGVEPHSRDLASCVLVVAEARGKRFCLVVDQLIGKQEVVIKSLGETFKHVPGIAGGAILGDGRVGLILDMDGLFGAAADA